jgi:hypothetical protein
MHDNPNTKGALGRALDDQPAPELNSERPVWDLVLADMRARDKSGKAKYGVPLQPFNGRNPLVDAYQEALDLVVYLRQAIIEWDRGADEQVRRERSMKTDANSY